MIKYRFGGKKGRSFGLKHRDDMVVVRSHDTAPVLDAKGTRTSARSREAHDCLQKFKVVLRFEAAGVEVLQSVATKQARTLRDRTRGVLKEEKNIRFAGRVLADVKTGEPVIYTENLFLKLEDDASPSAAKRLIKAAGLAIKQELPYARNAWFVGAPEGCGTKVFEIAANLLKEKNVEFCHPELVREQRFRGAFPDQWHLKKTSINGVTIDAHAAVESAWPLSTGAGVTIAVVDDGVDMSHEEFSGAGKIVSPRDVTRKTNNPSPGNDDNHGTACAGVACANGGVGASGVAPDARLMPIRLMSGLGSQAEADAFVWAADHGADIISCSWGPIDGRWWDPTDPRHDQHVPLPDSTRLAIDYAISNGRNGKGCVITWAAGNGNEDVGNDGYASYDRVVAVAACGHLNSRSVYSDMGDAIWCAFPSDHEPLVPPGIWTTDRSGVVGYNAGTTNDGDLSGNYTNSFGGTSSACPGAAGVAALILARNPNLRWDEVKNVLKDCCDKIDVQNGKYDAAGRSDWYGYGRLNARKAAELALPPLADRLVTHGVTQDVSIADHKTSEQLIHVGDTDPIQNLRVHVVIEHTYIGDLRVELQAPASIGGQKYLLHDRAGGGTDNIDRVFDQVNAPALSDLIGKVPKGTWTLFVTDNATADTGTLKGFSLELNL